MKKVPFFFFVALFLFYSSSLLAQDHNADMKSTGTHVMLNSAQLKWGEGSPALPKGIQMAVLAGDPSKEGMFTIRATMPANYKIPAHWHPTTEHVTVIEGTLYLGMGEKLDESKATELKTGGYAALPEKMAHFAFTKDKCVIQVQAMGPFALTYINPADDPRNKK